MLNWVLNLNETQIEIKINTLERRIKEINTKNITPKSMFESELIKLFTINK